MTSNEVHVLPSDDLVAHDDRADCGCQPITEAVQRSDGSYGWLIIHNAWDGRP